MRKFKKRILSLGLALILCAAFTMTAMAGAGMCPTCRGTDTESLGDDTGAEHVSEKCIHGYAGAYDQVDYLVYYKTIFCRNCWEAKITGVRYKQEMSRICQWAR